MELEKFKKNFILSLLIHNFKSFTHNNIENFFFLWYDL